MTDDQRRSETLTFFLAGHETTATALTWSRQATFSGLIPARRDARPSRTPG